MDERDFVRRSEFSQLDKRVGKTERIQERHDTKIEHIEDNLKDIKSNTNKIIWLVLSAIVVAVINFILEGGLF